MLVSFSTDWRFPPERSREIITDLLKTNKKVTYLEIDADQGHDAFLLPIPRYINALRSYLNRVSIEITNNAV